jgi:hypothetical protein
MKTIKSKINGPDNAYKAPTEEGYWAIALHADVAPFLGVPVHASSIHWRLLPGFGAENAEYWANGAPAVWFAQSVEGWFDRDDWYSQVIKANLLQALRSMGVDAIPDVEWFEPFGKTQHPWENPKALAGDQPPKPVYLPTNYSELIIP